MSALQRRETDRWSGQAGIFTREHGGGVKGIVRD